MSTISIQTTLSHELLKNSHDFIRSAVKYANEDDELSWKYSIIHVASAVELLLKSRLSEEHWSLVFLNPDKANVNNLMDGNFISVDIDTSINRLKNIVKIELSKKDKELINNLKMIRNRIIHYHMDINKNAIKGIVAQCLNTYINFYNSNIVSNWTEYSAFGNELNLKLKEFEEFVKVRMESLTQRLKNLERPKTNYFWECSECLQDAAILTKENKIHCLFCGKENDVIDVAKLYAEDNTVLSCPVCNIYSYVLISTKNDHKNYECLICGHYEGTPQIWIHTNGNVLPHIRNFEK